MSIASDKLREMTQVAPGQVEEIGNSIGQVEDQITEQTEEIAAVTDAVCTATTDDLTAYLEGDKLTELQALWPAVPGSLGPVYYVEGGTYGTINYSTGNITDWEFRQDNLVIPPLPAPPVPSPAYYVRYAYEGVGWDSDATIIELVDDFAFGNDYLTRPLTSGASYGMIPYKENLESAKDLLQENQDKVADSIDVFNRYAS